jgi:hypothetical protein
VTWTRLSDDFTDRPEFLKLSRSARLLHIEALVYCNRLTLDGYVPAGALRRLTDADNLDAEVQELIDAKWWESVDDGWQIDWSDQETAEEVNARKAYQAEKQKRYRQRRDKHRRGDHSECDPRFCKKKPKSVTGNETSNETGRVTDSRPGPSRPKGRGQGSPVRCPNGAIVAADGGCCDDCATSVRVQAAS